MSYFSKPIWERRKEWSIHNLVIASHPWEKDVVASLSIHVLGVLLCGIPGMFPGNCFIKKKKLSLALAGDSGLSTSLRTKALLVRFPVRAQAWVAGWVPGGAPRGHHTSMLMCLSLSFSLPLSLKIKR